MGFLSGLPKGEVLSESSGERGREGAAGAVSEREIEMWGREAFFRGS